MKNNEIKTTIPPAVRASITEIGELIACARKEKQWTQQELARRIGVSRMTVVRIEKGAPEVATGWYLTAAWLLGLSLLSWQTVGEVKSDTVVGDLLTKLKKTLPERVRMSRKRIDNDF